MTKSQDHPMKNLSYISPQFSLIVADDSTKTMANETFPEKYMRCLRVWIGFVAVMALGNTVQCFVDPQLLKSKLYTVHPENVNDLVAHLFGVWTLLSAGLRFYCAVDIYNKPLYNLTYFSFFLALGHFVTEVILFHSAVLTAGIIAPLTVSSLSIITMSIGYMYLDKQKSSSNVDDENKELARKMKRRVIRKTD